MSERVDGRTMRFAHRRNEVLQAATEHALEHGLADLSLRGVAQTVGVSHATLVHHFGTKDQLVAEIVDLVVARALAVPELPDDDPDPLRTIWRLGTSEPGDRYVRLFVAITGQAMYGSPALTEALDRSIRQRITLLADGLARNGVPPAEARSLATFVLATMRGLVVDLFVTGDEQRVHAAFEVLLADLKARTHRRS